LKFWASAEVHAPASPALIKVWHIVEPWLNDAFAASDLAPLECELRYVPIVMPKSMHDRYTARSKLRKKDRVYSCAPQLDYDIFVEGTYKEQLREYLRGIALSQHHLASLGASKTQIDRFGEILRKAEEILAVH
jgi:hypothetical protein